MFKSISARVTIIFFILVTLFLICIFSTLSIQAFFAMIDTFRHFPNEPAQQSIYMDFILYFFKVFLFKYFAAITTPLLFILVFYIGKRLINALIQNPINDMNRVIQDIGSGNFPKLYRNPPTEFKQVYNEFNSLTEQLKKNEELRKDLISDTSHELKTPITSIALQLEGMELGTLDMSKKRIKLIREQVDRLNTLINNLNNYAAIRSNKINLTKTNISSKEFLEELKENFRMRLSKDKFTLEYEIENIDEIHADKDALTQIITNIIDNAIKYSGGNKINISLSKYNLKISDNGKGIPEENLKDIFERFFRIEKSRNRDTGGSGLGLAIVKELVVAHGWKIKAINDNGLTFIISF